MSSKDEQRLGQNIGIGISIVLFVVILYLRYTGAIASPAEIVAIIEEWYVRYGLWVVLISAFIEGLFPLNLYYPGSTAILLGVAFAVKNGFSVPLYVITIIIGFYVAYTINYFVGRHGIYKLLLRFGYGDALKETEVSLREKGPRIMLSAFFHPNLAAIVTTGAGVIKMPFAQFALWTLISLVIWDTVWGIIAYFTGEYVIKLFSSWLVIPFMVFWLALVYVFLPRGKSRKPVLSKP